MMLTYKIFLKFPEIPRYAFLGVQQFKKNNPLPGFRLSLVSSEQQNHNLISVLNFGN